MSQQDILDILEYFGGKATSNDIRTEAKKRFPDRTLSSYVRKRLQAMKRQGIVDEVTIDGKSGWEIIAEDIDGLPGQITISDVDSGVTEENLRNQEISVRNIVGSFEIGQRLDLYALTGDIPAAEYHSETYSNMVYRFPEYESLTALVPASGRVTVVGAKSKQELFNGTVTFIEMLEELGLEVETTPEDVIIQNIVATGELEREVDLHSVSLALGLEDTEYNPEQFPGLVYRQPDLPVILLFTSGKIVITGAKTYHQVSEAFETITQKITELFQNDSS